MNVLLVGGGGREHAIVKKLRENPEVKLIFCLPGNGGMAAEADCVAIGAKELDGIVDFAAAHDIDFCVVAQDDPLALGCVDRLHALGLPCFGPEAAAARIESSKVFAKALMKKYGIPTADYRVFDELDAALSYLDEAPFPLVVKADGLALGKGVSVCQTRDEAEQALRALMEERRFGAAGSQVVVEEFLQGVEVSVLSFTDGRTIVPMISAMDHKRAGDGDTGPNTGGMGAIAPNPWYSREIARQCMERIFLPTIRAMAAEGCPFKGCLYFGLMLTERGPMVIEYNCRFGDPETQAVLPLLETDLLTVMQAVEEERLDKLDIRWSDEHSACVVLASRGYPGAAETGKAITLPETLPEKVRIFHAGDKLGPSGLVSSGGRVLGVSATGESLGAALDAVYAVARQVSFEGAWMRQDIGRRALEKEEG